MHLPSITPSGYTEPEFMDHAVEQPLADGSDESADFSEIDESEKGSDPSEHLAMLVGSYEFVGPFEDCDEIAAEEGLLAILIDDGRGFELVDLYETADLQHAARTELAKDEKDRLSAAVHYTAGLSAEEVEVVKEEILTELDSNQETLPDR